MRCVNTLRAGSIRQCQLEQGHDEPCTYTDVAHDTRGRHAGNFTYTWTIKEKP